MSATKTILLDQEPDSLVLCRACVNYIHPHEEICPFCGNDPKQEGDVYRARNFQYFEARNKILTVMDKLGISPEQQLGDVE